MLYAYFISKKGREVHQQATQHAYDLQRKVENQYELLAEMVTDPEDLKETEDFLLNIQSLLFVMKHVKKNINFTRPQIDALRAEFQHDSVLKAFFNHFYKVAATPSTEVSIPLAKAVLLKNYERRRNQENTQPTENESLEDVETVFKKMSITTI